MSWIRDRHRADGATVALSTGTWILSAIAANDILLTHTFAAGESRRYELIALHANVTKVVTTGSKLATLVVKRTRAGASTTLGVTLATTSANMTPEGAEVISTRTGGLPDNEIVSGDVVTVVASAATAYVEGEAEFTMILREI